MREQKPKRYQRRMPAPEFVRAIQWREGDADPPEAMGLVRRSDGSYVPYGPGDWKVLGEGPGTGRWTPRLFNGRFTPIPEPIDPTPGAEQAAKAIEELIDADFADASGAYILDMDKAAAIIEKHMGTGELLKGMKHVADFLRAGYDLSADKDEEQFRTQEVIELLPIVDSYIADAQRTDGGEEGE